MDTNDTTEVMYSTSEVAKLLKVGSPMVRKWALAYEGVTGDKVKLKSKRDGREFTSEQVGTISAAKQLVDIEGVRIDIALKMVIGQSELAAAVMTDELESLHTSKALEAILERHDETNRLLLEEIRGLRQDLQARKLPVVPSSVEKSKPGGIRGIIRRWLDGE